MLRWNELHPYNAVHAVRIPGGLEPMRLRDIIGGILERRGLTGLEIKAGRGAYCYHGGLAQVDLRTLEGTEDATTLLAAEAERQLNTGFPITERLNPFRFFTLPAGTSFWLGLAYFHPVADAESIVYLLQEVATACGGTPGSGSSDPPNLYPRSGDRLLLGQPAALARRLIKLPGYIMNLRRSNRPHYRNPFDFQNVCKLFSLPPADLQCLLDTGRAWEVTFNDLVLALLLKAVSMVRPAGRRGGKRHKLSVGAIVNLRKDLGIDSRQVFGLFLGSFVATHEVPDGISLRTLARDIRELTFRIKRWRQYLATPLELAVARLALFFFSTERQKKFYQKAFPLWGGITNMNLNSIWKAQAGKAPLDYIRAVSTGPVTPLVVSVTTVGDVANFGLTYRTSVFSAAEIDQIQRVFRDLPSRLETPA